jgi:pyruvate formate-lyase activating enzyme-like uncharacterized protein
MIRIFTNSEQFIPAVARISVRIMVLSRMKAVRQGLAWILQLYIVDNYPTHKPKARELWLSFREDTSGNGCLNCGKGIAADKS